MIYKLIYNDNAKLQMELIKVSGIDFSYEFHTEAHANWIGEFEDTQYVTIKTGDDNA